VHGEKHHEGERMSANPRRLPVSKTSKTKPDRPITFEAKTFQQKLKELMAEKGMSQSDLARAVWGTFKDNRGFEVARNRDRISQYVTGKSVPEPGNLVKLAKVLGVEPKDLAPDVTKDAIKGETQTALTMKAIQGHPDQVLLKLELVMDIKTAASIIEIVSKRDLLS
jgi:transcriptional regulator with XRE-family HTH domain